MNANVFEKKVVDTVMAAPVREENKPLLIDMLLFAGTKQEMVRQLERFLNHDGYPAFLEQIKALPDYASYDESKKPYVFFDRKMI